jgi:hypothetical protein
MYLTAVEKSVMVYLQNYFYNKIFKITRRWVSPPPPPPRKNLGALLAQIYDKTVTARHTNYSSSLSFENFQVQTVNHHPNGINGA